MSKNTARRTTHDLATRDFATRRDNIPTIAHVITGLKIGGAEMMLYKLLANIANNGNMHHVVISLRKTDVIGERISALGVPVFALNSTPTDPLLLKRLVTTLRDVQPDVLQGWMYHANIATTLATSALRGTPPVAWGVRALPSSIYSRLTRGVIWTGARLSNRPRAIVYNSSASAVAHSEIGYKSDRAIVINNGFDTELFKPSDSSRSTIRNQLGIRTDDLVIGLLARLNPAKDFNNFFAAFAEVQKNVPNVHAILAGTDVVRENEQIQSLLQQHNLQYSNIHLLGERQNTNEIWDACDIGCSSSLTESFSNSIGEAMSCGAPCVVTDVGDSAKIVGDSGIVVPPSNSSALANALTTMLQLNDCDFVFKRLAARSRIVEMFGMDAAGQAFENVYRNMLATA